MEPIQIQLSKRLARRVQQEAEERGFDSAEEYLRELLERERLRTLLLDSHESATGPATNGS